MTLANGWILYEGPSQLDGQPIVCIATGARTPTSNRKTGMMLQTWVLLSNVHPNEAIHTGADRSICGNCPLRLNARGHRICYVKPMPLGQIYKQYRAGRYDRQPILNYNLPARIGSYGDPTAVPIEVWRKLIKSVPYTTGYTRQWTNPAFKDYQAFCMASVFTLEEARLAASAGWKTYRTRLGTDNLVSKEIECPASITPLIVTCATCKLCTGSKSNVSIKVHGNNQNKFGLVDLNAVKESK